MNLSNLIAQLEANSNTIASLVSSVSLEQARWKPSAKRWSILEVMCHLADEEREDFRTRVRSMLFDDPSGSSAGQIDPKGWVKVRGYNTRVLSDAIADFQRERVASLEWLRDLPSPDWSRTHRRAGRRAGDFMASWAAHDLLHVKQITRLRYDWLALEMQPFSVDYAGDWT